MTKYLIRRLLQAIPTVIGITVISFLLMHLAPGDPVDLLTYQPNITPEYKKELTKRLCLDRTLAEQYAVWIVGDWRGVCQQRGLIRGDFGTSFYENRPVLEMILEKIPATLELTFVSLIVGLLIGVPIGAIAAVKQGGWFDNFSRFFAVIFDAIPAFWLGLILILLFATTLGWLPTGGRTTLNLPGGPNLLDRIRHLILPVAVFSVGWVAVLSRYMRAETLEVIRQDYVRTANAKGLDSWRVYLWHAGRNALIPIATLLGPAIAGLLGGAVVIERIFSWPGLGRLLFDAVSARDYPLIMAGVIIGSVLTILGNLLSDIFYVLVDPRIRLE
ncbi:MAG: ABC transporter permease [Chloroflexota bacterium]